MNRLLRACIQLSNRLKITREKDYIKYKGLNLPKIRSNENLNREEDYIDSITQQIEYLKTNSILEENFRILDFGCGQGRLLNGLLYNKVVYKEYVGLDTSQNAITWCRRYLNYNDKIKFIHLPSYNARYNSKATGLRELPLDIGKFNLIFLNSVFSHMLSEDIVFYLNEFNKYLEPNGYVYITAFIEENVPDETENPENYLSQNKGPLHRVRYSKDFFFRLIHDCGFKVFDFNHRHIARTNQSVIVLKNNNMN